MRALLNLILFLALPVTACAQPNETETELKSQKTVEVPHSLAPLDAPLDPVNVALKAADAPLVKHAEIRAKIGCDGIAKQGGLILCKTDPKAKVKIARSEDDFYFENADAEGRLIVGFDRDETRTFLEYDGQRLNFDLEPRAYDTSRINGLPKNMVSEYTPEELKRIRAATARKKAGFASRVEDIGFKNGFIYPIQEDFIKTTNFGAQRILNDIPKKPHYGVDLAAPKGTPIVAPAAGIVSLADDDMYFEGSLILIDHGQGLISYYLHNDTVLVKDGQRVRQGEQIATVGSKGRSTGPHLCWRLKWRNRNLDPELLTEWPNAH